MRTALRAKKSPALLRPNSTVSDQAARRLAGLFADYAWVVLRVARSRATV
jgi:hypothetical protein